MSEKSEAEYRVRDFMQSDYQAVTNLWTATGLSQPQRKDDLITILRTLAHGGRLILLVDDQDHIIGSSWITHDFRRSWIHHFAIDPNFQGKGLSHTLMKETTKILDLLGYQVKLEVHQHNERAISLYRKYGFKELEGYLVYMKR